ncbi:hypothetical protein UFOVP736_29 [uncultured Caudovirales phage]|uniref:Glycosyl transferase family 25 domain-containing protein n=1 Tax=uncultured Caudovirales phage TaxID=2100421 RepID=A0A6J7X4T5_9CAUD|nr:hypothetical protein UFOVP705_52 [uncultured Caudovirales phage]CAB5224060.1 hypothetical protein UFOVP736_29 [uncultured Caudovirales phage]
MILDEKFNRVVVISGHAGRRDLTLRRLKDAKLSQKAEWQRAVMGDELRPPAWWAAGGGAWGCLCSHRHVVERAYLDGLETVCIIEDDAVWQEGAATLLRAFLKKVPNDWGQIYLGGTHRRQPEWVCDEVLRGWSVNRTHAYVIHRRCMPRFLAHIQHAPDYIASTAQHQGKQYHIDHQLEVAHRRGDWKVYAPSWWLCGQGENLSSINGAQQPEQWWHWDWDNQSRDLPIVVVPPRHRDAEGERSLLWYGAPKHRIDGTRMDAKIKECLLGNDAEGLLRNLRAIAHEAFTMERLPAVEWADFSAIEKVWPALRRGKLTVEKLDALRHVRKQSWFKHRWKAITA